MNFKTFSNDSIQKKLVLIYNNGYLISCRNTEHEFIEVFAYNDSIIEVCYCDCGADGDIKVCVREFRSNHDFVQNKLSFENEPVIIIPKSKSGFIF